MEGSKFLRIMQKSTNLILSITLKPVPEYGTGYPKYGTGYPNKIPEIPDLHEIFNENRTFQV